VGPHRVKRILSSLEGKNDWGLGHRREGNRRTCRVAKENSLKSWEGGLIVGGKSKG